MNLLNVFSIAGSALTAQSARLNAVASNLANADSVAGPGGQPYRAKQVIFNATQVEGGGIGVRATRLVESSAPFRMMYEPQNPAADAEGYVAMPNVNVVDEMVNMISASRAYQNNVEVMNTAKALIQKALAIGQ